MSSLNTSQRQAPLWQILGAFLGLALAVGLANSVWPDRIYHFDPRRAGSPTPIDVPWLLTFSRSVLAFLWWLPLAPLAVILARRADVLAPRRWRAVAVHLAAAALLSFLHLQLSFLLYADYAEWKVLEHPGPVSDMVMRRWPASFFLYWIIAGITYAFDYSLRYRKRAEEAAAARLKAINLEAEVARAGLFALQAQLNPHFLFNTLNSISALVGSRPIDARRLIASLSELLRLTLDEGEKPVIPLREELAWLAKYVEIQQIRFEERLAVEVIAPDEALDILVPSLILQPLVENAIKHGLEKHAGRVTIRIRWEREGGMLHLIVADDGPGFSADFREGVGLSNTRQRLSLLYGSRHAFLLRNARDGGAEAVVDLPVETPDEARASDLVIEEVGHDG